jgi:hypothetical protein
VENDPFMKVEHFSRNMTGKEGAVFEFLSKRGITTGYVNVDEMYIDIGLYGHLLPHRTYHIPELPMGHTCPICSGKHIFEEERSDKFIVTGSRRSTNPKYHLISDFVNSNRKIVWYMEHEFSSPELLDRQPLPGYEDLMVYHSTMVYGCLHDHRFRLSNDMSVNINGIVTKLNALELALLMVFDKAVVRFVKTRDYAISKGRLLDIFHPVSSYFNALSKIIKNMMVRYIYLRLKPNDIRFSSDEILDFNIVNIIVPGDIFRFMYSALSRGKVPFIDAISGDISTLI